MDYHKENYEAQLKYKLEAVQKLSQSIDPFLQKLVGSRIGGNPLRNRLLPAASKCLDSLGRRYILCKMHELLYHELS